MANIIKDYIEPGLKLLPQKMDTPDARAMLVAIGLQESGFAYRKQVGGPARSFWQFEMGGVTGVLTHDKTSAYISEVCKYIVLPAKVDLCYGVIAYHDALACCFARLLLYTLPSQLPKQYESDEGWKQYVAAWRPGKPRYKDWPQNFDNAWRLVTSGDKLS